MNRVFGSYVLGRLGWALWREGTAAVIGPVRQSSTRMLRNLSACRLRSMAVFPINGTVNGAFSQLMARSLHLQRGTGRDFIYTVTMLNIGTFLVFLEQFIYCHKLKL